MSGAEPAIAVENLSLCLGRFALRDVTLAVKKGEYKVLLGPTGGGKTVLLETIIGLHRPDDGRILVSGAVVDALCPEERNIGYVPQDYSLFPNLTVAGNVAFGPRVRGWPSDRIEERVGELLELLGIAHLRDRYVTFLSGGEKQRVAMGRALAVEPEVLILDEPLSALDENRRSELAAGLLQIQRQVGGTFLHVCHNLDEATQVADGVAIINDGEIVQDGTITEILYQPATEFVARFTGTRNVFSARVAIDGPNRTLVLEDGTSLKAEQSLNDATHVAVRPESIRLCSPDETAPRGNVLEGEVVGVTSRALSHELTILPAENRLAWTVIIPRAQGIPCPNEGTRARFTVPSEALWLIRNVDTC